MKTQFFSAQVYDVYIGEHPPVNIIQQESNKSCSGSLIFGFLAGVIAGVIISRAYYMTIDTPVKMDPTRLKK